MSDEQPGCSPNSVCTDWSVQKPAIIEICVCSVEGAAAALEGGAHQVELCCDFVEGGLTPSHGLIKLVREKFPRPGKLNVLIRPRGGDFNYNQSELQVMLEDISHAAALGADGVAFGCLTTEAEVDMDSTDKLLQLARTKGLEVTFHRAFDMCRDLSASLQQLRSLGITRVLTSGGMPSAIAGAGSVARLVGEAGKSMKIVAAGNVTWENISDIVIRTGVTEVHSSARRSIISKMRYRNPNVSLCGNTSDYLWDGVDVKNVVQLKDKHQKAVATLPKDSV